MSPRSGFNNIQFGEAARTTNLVADVAAAARGDQPDDEEMQRKEGIEMQSSAEAAQAAVRDAGTLLIQAALNTHKPCRTVGNIRNKFMWFKR